MAVAKLHIRTKRIYEPAEEVDGIRILVDRLWPRGLSRKDANIDAWLKDIAPSPVLRKWFHHDPQRWTDFRRRYREELTNNPDAVARINALAANDPVTLLYAAQDENHNHALVLAAYLEHQGGAKSADADR